MGKNCEICGRPSGFFPLCKTCNELKEDGKIVKCETCGSWHESDKECKNCNNDKDNIIDISTQDTCLICGEDSNGYHFCTKCFHKFNNKEVIIKISNCQNAEVLESQYNNKKITAYDGHIVKSNEEARIDDYFYTHNINHRYEKEYTPNNQELGTIYPDWILPNYKDLGDVYVEYWGVKNNENYNRQKDYKMKIYKEDKVTLICLYPEDMDNLTDKLDYKLKRCEKGKIN
ncbi:MAG: hypothetical protein J1F31_04330 [Erysipelotrichales bacterium]|nr:hypothetical protein [Erysipelotrichales bacterium]